MSSLKNRFQINAGDIIVGRKVPQLQGRTNNDNLLKGGVNLLTGVNLLYCILLLRIFHPNILFLELTQKIYFYFGIKSCQLKKNQNNVIIIGIVYLHVVFYMHSRKH